MILFKIRRILCLIVLLIAISSVTSEDFYKLLGVSQDATKSEIRRAFKKLALEKHPDKNPVSIICDMNFQLFCLETLTYEHNQG